MATKYPRPNTSPGVTRHSPRPLNRHRLSALADTPRMSLVGPNYPGPELDTQHGRPHFRWRVPVSAPWVESSPRPSANKRQSPRIPVMLPARLTWKDQRGAAKFASVVTRDVSEFGVFVESPTPLSIPLFRLVQFQLERDTRDADALPDTLRQGRLLSAVYRVHQPSRLGGRQGLALRLMVDPKRNGAGRGARFLDRDGYEGTEMLAALA